MQKQRDFKICFICGKIVDRCGGLWFENYCFAHEGKNCCPESFSKGKDWGLIIEKVNRDTLKKFYKERKKYEW